MRCETAAEHLSAHFDGELPGSASVEIESHVAQCQSCQAELHSYERIRGLVGARGVQIGQPPPWSSIAGQVRAERVVSATVSPVTSAPKPRRSKLKDAVVIAASLAASIAIIAWTWRPAEQPVEMASMDHSHHASQSMHATAINFQDTVSLQQHDTRVAMQTLANKYEGREASLDEVVKSVGFKPLVQSPLPSGARLVSSQLLTMPQCNCEEGHCMCGPGQCNCVACICERPDGSTFLVIEQCQGQDVNFGDLPVRLVKRGGQELWVTGDEAALSVTWIANNTRKVAVGLRDLNEMDQLLAVN